MLSNIVFIIILILLVIILVLLYFFSNDIRKNKNKLNICESDLNSLRERMSTMNQKIQMLESNPPSSMKTNKAMNFDAQQMPQGQNFVDILEKLGSMGNQNDFFMNEDDEDVSEASDEDENDDEDEDDEDEDDEDDVSGASDEEEDKDNKKNSKKYWNKKF